MVMQPIPLGYQSYKSRSLAIQGQRLINMYSEKMPDNSIYPYMLISRGGLLEQVDFGTDAPIRGMRVFNGFLWVVCGFKVYRVDTGLNITEIADITNDTKPVMMEDNSLQLAILTNDNDYYVFDGDGTPVATAIPFIIGSITFAAQSIIANKLNTREFYLSDVGDAATFDLLTVLTAEQSSDLIIRVYFAGNSLYIFKERSIQFYYFDTVSGLLRTDIGRNLSTIGIAGKLAVCQIDETVFFVGNDRILYAFLNFKAQKISTFAIDNELQLMESIDDCVLSTFCESGHKFVMFNFPTGQQTYVYDTGEGLFHERYTYGRTDWNVIAPTVFDGFLFLGDKSISKLYRLSSVVYRDGIAVPIERIVHTPTISKNRKRLFFKKIQLDFDEGLGEVTGDDVDPQVVMQYSDDGSRTFNNELWRSMGAAGKFQTRAIWYQGGAAYERVYRFSCSANIPVRYTGLYGDIGEGIG